MIEQVYSAPRTFVNYLSDLPYSINRAIDAIALPILSTIGAIFNPLLTPLVPPFLCYLSPNLFGIGFMVGFVCSSYVKDLSKRVSEVYSVKRSFLEYVGLAFLAAWNIPISVIAATTYYSLQYGRLFYENSISRLNNEGETH